MSAITADDEADRRGGQLTGDRQTMVTNGSQDMNGSAAEADLWSNGWFTPSENSHPLKRNIDINGEASRKRHKDNDMDLTDDKYGADFNIEEAYEEMTADDHMMLNITNQLINFSMARVPLPEWPDDDQPMTKPKPNPKKPEFPPKTGESIHGYRLNQLLSATKRTAVFVGFKEKRPEESVIVKIGFEMGFHSLQTEHINYGKLRGSKSVVKILDYIWFVFTFKIVNKTPNRWIDLQVESLSRGQHFHPMGSHSAGEVRSEFGRPHEPNAQKCY